MQEPLPLQADVVNVLPVQAGPPQEAPVPTHGPKLRAPGLHVCVQRLRRKIDVPGQPSLIVTRRSEGYMLSTDGEP